MDMRHILLDSMDTQYIGAMGFQRLMFLWRQTPGCYAYLTQGSENWYVGLYHEQCGLYEVQTPLQKEQLLRFFPQFFPGAQEVAPPEAIKHVEVCFVRRD